MFLLEGFTKNKLRLLCSRLGEDTALVEYKRHFVRKAGISRPGLICRGCLGSIARLRPAVRQSCAAPARLRARPGPAPPGAAPQRLGSRPGGSSSRHPSPFPGSSPGKQRWPPRKEVADAVTWGTTCSWCLVTEEEGGEAGLGTAARGGGGAGGTAGRWCRMRQRAWSRPARRYRPARAVWARLLARLPRAAGCQRRPRPSLAASCWQRSCAGGAVTAEQRSVNWGRNSVVGEDTEELCSWSGERCREDVGPTKVSECG